MKQQAQTPETKGQRRLIAGLLLAGTFIAILNQTLMITAIPPIMHEMHITANSAQWLTTVFMLVNGVMVPVSAFLIEKFTTRRLFLSAMSIFVVGTVICAIAPTFQLLLLGRVVQSAGAGIMLPLMQTVFLLIFPVKNRGAAMGIIGLVISFAPAIGPALSGWITEHYSWRVLFELILPIAVIDILVAAIAMKNVTELTNPKVDVVSIILSSFGFGGLLYGFSCAGNYGWGAVSTVVSLAIGTVTLFLFIRRQLKMRVPMLEFKVFGYPIFTLATGITMIVFMGLIGAETLIPLYMQNVRGFNAMQSGLVLLPGALIMGITSPITGRIFDRIGARWLAIIGMALFAAATIPFTNLDPTTSFAFVTTMYAIRMLGMSMVMMPVTTAGLNQLPKKLIPHGAAMSNTMRMVAGAVGTAILVTVMTTTAEHADALTPTQAHIHGINVAFMVAAILAIIGLLASFFVKRTHPPDDDIEQNRANHAIAKNERTSTTTGN
ncbi:MAG TPA: MDR family MFS transporter [Bacillales bacterium]|nr:MDR family MFS transporter [Bacillales bacterium]